MRKIFIFIILILILMTNNFAIVYAETSENDSDISIEEILENIDTSEIEELLKRFGEEELSVFGYSSIKDKLIALSEGKDEISSDTFFEYIFVSFFSKLKNIIPFTVSILVVCILFSIIRSIKGKFASESTAIIIDMACISLVMVIVFSQIMNMVSACRLLMESFQSQIDAVFPVLLTLITAIGSSKTAAVYQPAVAILGSLTSNVITVFAFPCFLLSIVFHVVGNLSEGIKLKSLADFFSSALKWVLGTAFFVFLAFLSLQGITASVYDNIYIRTTKLALSKYVPIIGSYLSEGYNLVISGSILIKNGLGLSGILIMILSIVPIIAQISVFSVSLKAISAICEPLGCDKICTMLKGIGKSVSTLMAIVLGIAFLYFIFILLVVCTGNAVI